MLRGLSFVRHKFYIVLDSLLVLIIAAGLFGCGSPQTTEIIVPLTFCTPESPLTNVYRATPQPWANAIFEVAFPSYIPTPIPPNPVQINEQQLLSARYSAFQQLEHEVKRWSDIKTVNLGDSSKAEIIVTFLSPELLHAVFLNEVLKNRYPTYGLQEQLKNTLEKVAMRDELLFLLTVTTTSDNVNPTRHTMKIPIKSMTLNNAENLQISPSHDDHNLDLPMDSSSEPGFGYLAYPLTQISASKCKWILDPKYNTNIVMTVPFIEVDGTSNNTPVSWTIPYAPLMSPIMPINTPVSILPFGFDSNLYPMTPLTVPPVGMGRATSWMEFAQFVWGQVMLGNY